MLRLCSDSSRSYPGRSVSHAVKLTVATPGLDLPGNKIQASSAVVDGDESFMETRTMGSKLR